MLTKKRVILALMMAVLLIGSIIAWAQTSASTALNITSGSSVSGGGIADTSALSGTFTITRGKAEVIAGVELFQVDLASSSYSNQVRIFVSWLDPQNASGALNNPNAWIDVQVWYEDVGGSITITDKDGNPVIVIQDTGGTPDIVTQRLSRVSGEVILKPTISGKNTLYILMSITTPGGVPPGQQSRLDSLDFWCTVKQK